MTNKNNYLIMLFEVGLTIKLNLLLTVVTYYVKTISANIINIFYTEIIMHE